VRQNSFIIQYLVNKSVLGQPPCSSFVLFTKSLQNCFHSHNFLIIIGI